jgi:DNA-binding PadR family transcriptional regulator
MVTDIAEFSGVRLGPGTLYTALQRLEGEGLIQPLSSPDRRRPYRITASGLAVLRADADDARRVAGVAARRLAPR